MIPFLKLLRLKNLATITIAMMGVAYFIHVQNPYEVIDFNNYHFGLLIFSTVLIAAAGHMINDYFDIKADRINKPEQLVLTKFLSKRWAILLNWILNILGLTIAFYLSWQYKNLLFVAIHLLSINFFWFYSAYWKRKLILGPVVLSLLPSLVLFLSCWYIQACNESAAEHSPYHPETWSTYLDYRFIYFVSICAFFITLSREIIKDIHDIPGDTIIKANTIPRKIGSQRAQLLSLLILQLPALLYFLLLLFTDFGLPTTYTKGVLLFVGLGFLLSLLLHYLAPNFLAKNMKWIQNIALLLGLTCLFF